MIVIQSDATTLPVIKKGLGKTHRGFIWVYRGDAQFPYVCYDYSDTEHSMYPERKLKGYRGIIQTDGTNKFNNLIKEGATSANCWAHVHCYFEDAWKSDPTAAEFPMGVIKSLFDILAGTDQHSTSAYVTCHQGCGSCNAFTVIEIHRSSDRWQISVCIDQC